MKHSVRNNNRSSPIMMIAVSLAISLLISFIGCVFTTYMISGGKWGEEHYGTASFILWLIGTLSGTMILGLTIKEKRLLMIGISALLYFLFLVGMHIMFFEGSISRIGQGILAIILGSIPSVVLSLRKNASNQKKIKYRR